MSCGCRPCIPSSYRTCSAASTHLGLYVLGCLLDDLFDPAGMDSAIGHEALHRDPGDLTPDRIKTRQDHGFRRVIHDDVNSRSVFEGADISTFAPYDAALHVITGEGYYGDRDFGGMIHGHSLNRHGDDLLRLALRLAPAPFSNLAHGLRRLGPGFLFDPPDELGPGFLSRHACERLDPLPEFRLLLLYLGVGSCRAPFPESGAIPRATLPAPGAGPSRRASCRATPRAPRPASRAARAPPAGLLSPEAVHPGGGTPLPSPRVPPRAAACPPPVPRPREFPFASDCAVPRVNSARRASTRRPTRMPTTAPTIAPTAAPIRALRNSILSAPSIYRLKGRRAACVCAKKSPAAPAGPAGLRLIRVRDNVRCRGPVIYAETTPDSLPAQTVEYPVGKCPYAAPVASIVRRIQSARPAAVGDPQSSGSGFPARQLALRRVREPHQSGLADRRGDRRAYVPVPGWPPSSEHLVRDLHGRENRRLVRLGHLGPHVRFLDQVVHVLRTRDRIFLPLVGPNRVFLSEYRDADRTLCFLQVAPLIVVSRSSRPRSPATFRGCDRRAPSLLR